jgi:metal-dependent amidase/aminoacylase/carboxypeptidase family protein
VGARMSNVASRQLPIDQDPMQTGVLTCGTINGGYAANIIADNVVICGTCRSFTAETQVSEPCVHRI